MNIAKRFFVLALAALFLFTSFQVEGKSATASHILVNSEKTALELKGKLEKEGKRNLGNTKPFFTNDSKIRR